ncbi:MAG: hypothetical protein ACXWB9_04700 [Flavisolibacter sp.]
MKQLITSAFLILLALGVSAQDAKYMKAMQEKVAAVDTTFDLEKLKDLSAGFERIAMAEKTQWLPYYYAALTQVNTGLMMSTQGALPADKVDPIADKAELLINKALELNKEHSDIYIVKKMIANLRMAPGEMSRYMQYGPEGSAALELARKLDPENPRVSLLEGQDKFFTPEQFGGSKTEAKKLFEDALKKFETHKPASVIDPSWGKTTALYFLNQIK